MKRLLYLMMCLVIAAPAKSIEYQSVLVEGSAGVLIDGNLSDWQAYKLPPQKLEYWQSMPHNRQGTPTTDQDLSATLQVFADADHIYFAVVVVDDEVVFERAVFGQSWWDDTVWIECGEGDLVITRRASGEVVVESLLDIAGKKISLPYLSEAIGIDAAISQTASGYTVEAKVPRQVVQLDAFKKGSRLLFNVSVVDHDVAGIQEHRLSLDKETLSPILLSQIITSPSRNENIPRRHPSGKPAIPPAGATLPTKSKVNNQGQFVITLLGNPTFDKLDLAKRREINTATILAQYRTATQVDKPNPRTLIWTGGLAGILAVREGNYRIFSDRFRDIQKVGDPYVQEWAVMHHRGYQRGFGRTMLKLPDAEAILRLEEALQIADETQDHEFYFETLSNLYKVRQRAQLPIDQMLEKGIDYATRIVDQFGTDKMGQLAATNRLKYRLFLAKSQPFLKIDGLLAKQEILRYSEHFSRGSDEHLDLLKQIGNIYRKVEMAPEALEFYEKIAELAQTPVQAVVARIGNGAYVYGYCEKQDVNGKIARS